MGLTDPHFGVGDMIGAALEGAGSGRTAGRSHDVAPIGTTFDIQHCTWEPSKQRHVLAY